MLNLTQTYPAHDDVEIPIGTVIELTFDKGVDLKSAENFIILYGRDYDQVRGPAAAVHIRDGRDPLLFQSPGFRGLVPVTITGSYYDGAEAVLEALSPADETGYTYVIKVTPKEPLAAQINYFLNIVGDPDEIGKGLASRTVWDTIEDDVVSTTGNVFAVGGYTGLSDDQLVIEITTAGDISELRYSWYWNSNGSGSAKLGRRGHSKYLTIDRNVQIKLDGTGFLAGDVYRINCTVPERLVATVKVNFTTNDGSYSNAPDSPSTPAEQEPPSTVIPPFPGEAGLSYLAVEMYPPDLSYNIDLETRTITLTFSEDIDETTVSDLTVVVEAFPIEGVYTGTGKKRVLSKNLQVVGNTITIEI